MRQNGIRTWTHSEKQLWGRIASHSFEVEGHVLTFTGRLARDHGWTVEFTRRAIEEYRRFCFLTIVSDVEVTPSEEVDEVWHLHLTFSVDYWERWCRHALGRSLHHQPTTGGPAEATRFAEQYAATLSRYESYFGPPDAIYWPSTAQRFAARPRYRMIDRARTVVFHVPENLIKGLQRVSRVLGLTGILSLLTTRPASAASWNVLDWEGKSFLIFYMLIAGLAFTLPYILEMFIESRKASGQDRGTIQLDAIHLALLCGGRTRAADVLALQLLEGGHLNLSADQTFIPLSAGQHQPPAFLGPFLAARNKSITRSSLVEMMEPWLDQAWDKLASSGLALQRSDVRLVRMVADYCVAPVLAIGIVKIVVGLSRDKPVVFLCIFVGLTLFLRLWVRTQQRFATEKGTLVVSEYRAQHARAIRAPLPDEAITAFAMIGPLALSGTALAAYATLIKPPGNDAGSGCGAGSGGGSSGCGGCGGGH